MNSSSGISDRRRISRAISSTLCSVVPALQRAFTGALDDRAIGNRIGERHAQLDQVRAAALERFNQCRRAVRRRIAGRDVGDESPCVSGSSTFEQSRDAAHASPTSSSVKFSR